MILLLYKLMFWCKYYRLVCLFWQWTANCEGHSGARTLPTVLFISRSKAIRPEPVSGRTLSGALLRTPKIKVPPSGTLLLLLF